MVTKSARLELRVSPDDKALIEAAAAISGQPVATFAISHLRQQARQVLGDYQVTYLSERDWSLFNDLIAAPPPPTPALREAFKRHGKRR